MHGVLAVKRSLWWLRTLFPTYSAMYCSGFVVLLVLGVTCIQAADEFGGCLYDGHVYNKGESIIIQPCLASMTCEGNNVYSQPISLGGLCPKSTRDVDGQSGCLLDGHVYAKGEVITIQPCLARLTCLGHNVYSDITTLGGQC